jgi:hypothetical protein
MPYTILLPCACTAYVGCWPDTGIAHTRVIEFRSPGCRVRTHERGAKVYLWELLPKSPAETASVHPTSGSLPSELPPSRLASPRQALTSDF